MATSGDEEVKVTETEITVMENILTTESMSLILPAEEDEEENEVNDLDNGDEGDGMKDYQMDEESIAEVDPNISAMGSSRSSFLFPVDNPMDTTSHDHSSQTNGEENLSKVMIN